MTAARAFTTEKENEEQAVREFRPLVRRMARALSARSGGDADDLSAAGERGVLEAVRRFDPTRGASLTAYVAQRAHGAMRDELRSADRLSRRTRHRVTNMLRTRAGLARGGGEPSRADVAQALGVDVAEVVRLEQLTLPPLNVDDLLDDLPHASGAGDDPCTTVLRQEEQAAVRAAVAALPERLRLVVLLRSVDERPLKELAALLGVTEPRVSQLYRSALEKLRLALQRELYGALA